MALGLCAVGGAVTLLGHLVVGPMAEPSRVPLANMAGAEACPSLAGIWLIAGAAARRNS